MAEDETSYETLKTSLSEELPLVPRPERRRSWHPQQKMAIVQASCAPGAGPTEVARRYDISTGLLYTWRKQLGTPNNSGVIEPEMIHCAYDRRRQMRQAGLTSPRFLPPV